MYLEVLQAREALVAGGTAMRLLIGVCADVDQHLVSAVAQSSALVPRFTSIHIITLMIFPTLH